MGQTCDRCQPIRVEMTMRAVEECGKHATKLFYEDQLVELGIRRTADYKAAQQIIRSDKAATADE